MEAPTTPMMHSAMPFTEVLGIEITTAAPEVVVATGEWSAERTTSGGLLHGGYLMAVADSVGALLAFLNVPPGATTATIESKTNFLRPVSSGRLTVTATPVHVGRTMIVVQTDVVRDDGALVSRTTQTQAVLS